MLRRMQGRSITKRLSKKDANNFLKAIKRFGRIERMADIAQEVGPALQDQPASARYLGVPEDSSQVCAAVAWPLSAAGFHRYALWWGLIHGCEKVERLAAEKKADPKDALLDWFGVGLKAQEVSSFVKRMDLLSHRVRPCRP